MESTYQVAPDVFVLPSIIPVPGLGSVPVYSYLVTGAQPYLVDTGMILDRDAYLDAFEALMDYEDLRWIFLTHDDPDHIGALVDLLERAPQARVITNFIGMAKLALLQRPVPPPQLQLMNPGEQLDLGDRTLAAVRPPLFDSPETTAVYDSKLDALFSADSFGCPVTTPHAPALANEIPGDTLLASQMVWATIDSPWIHDVDRARFGRTLDEIARRDPDWIMSSHLPPARRYAATLCANLARAPEAPRFVGPNQGEFQALMAQAGGEPAAAT